MRVRGHEIAIGMLIASVFWTMILAWQSTPSAYAEICEEAKSGQDGANKDCPTYHIVFVALWHVAKALANHNTAITAAAGAVVAIFTVTLWWTTRRLWQAGERQLRLIEANATEQAVDMKASIAVAAKSAEATAAAAEAAKQSLESERAWITWDTITFADLVNATIKGKLTRNGVGVAALWRNTGRSPAENVSCVNMFKLIKPGDPEPIFEATENDQATRESSRGVGAEVSGFLCTLSDAESDEFRGGKFLIFYSRVRYNDVFRRAVVRVSEACVQITFAGGLKVVGGKQQAPINFTLVGPQNGVT